MDLNERKHNNVEGDWAWFHNFAGIGMPSNYYTFHIFSKIIDENPQIGRIIELGTFKGSMTVALGLEGIRKGIDVHTWEISKQISEETEKLFSRLGIKAYNADIWGNKEFIKTLFDRPVYLLCDNGHKATEFQEFVPHLKPGSIVSVHDWNTEVHPRDIESLNAIIEPFHEDDWMKHNVQLATWRVK